VSRAERERARHRSKTRRTGSWPASALEPLQPELDGRGERSQWGARHRAARGRPAERKRAQRDELRVDGLVAAREQPAERRARNGDGAGDHELQHEVAAAGAARGLDDVEGGDVAGRGRDDAGVAVVAQHGRQDAAAEHAFMDQAAYAREDLAATLGDHALRVLGVEGVQQRGDRAGPRPAKKSA
jgi:hypothetical protein